MNICETQSLERGRETVKEFADCLNFFYVYMLINDDGDCFYVGKGVDTRFRDHRRKWGEYSVSFAGFCMFEEDAYQLEREVIALGRVEGWPLKNKAAGGKLPDHECLSKAITDSWKTPSKRENRCSAMRGVGRSDEAKRAMSEAQQRPEVIAKVNTPEAAKKKSVALLGRSKPEGFGEKISKSWLDEEIRAARLVGVIGRVQQQETCDKISKANSGRIPTAEELAKMRRPRSLEGCAAIKRGALLREARKRERKQLEQEKDNAR